MAVTLVRYWGSFFKTPRQAREFARVFVAAAARGWRTHLVCCRPPDDAGVVWRALRLCRCLHCDVFHCDNMHTSPLIGARLAGVPVRLWSKRSMQPAFEEDRTPTLRDRAAISVRVSCRLATRVVAVSSAVRDELVGLGIPLRKFVVFPNPVPELAQVDRGQARAGYGHGDDELVIATVGHAVPAKGWETLLRAFRRVVAEVPKARLLLVGSTSAPQERVHFDELLRLVELFGLTERVHFAGHVPDVSVPLAAADVFALPSRSEGSSNALLEALHAGLPCVSARVGAAADLIQPGENGLLVEREDEEGLANALRLLASDADLREQLARSLRATPTAWNPDQYAKGLVDLYASLLGLTKQSALAKNGRRPADSALQESTARTT
jgi:glycosyltransferase involved in cell wall biosynthesis